MQKKAIYSRRTRGSVVHRWQLPTFHHNMLYCLGDNERQKGRQDRKEGRREWKKVHSVWFLWVFTLWEKTRKFNSSVSTPYFQPSFTHTRVLSLSLCVSVIPIREQHTFFDVRSIRCRKMYSNTTHKFRMCGQSSLITSKAALSTTLLMHILQ